MTVQETAPGGQEAEQQEQQPQTPGESKPQEGSEQPPKTYDEPYVKELRQSEAKTRTENKSLKAELEKVRQASMTADEKAVAEAEARGRSAAASDFGKRLARAEFNAQAGRRNAAFKVDDALEYVDLGKFVAEDGEPDVKAISAAVERLVPAGEAAPPSFDGGGRTPAAGASGQNMSADIRRALGR